MITISKSLKFILAGIAFILALPLVAMQFTSEVNWTISDFLVAGSLLMFFGFLLETAIRKIHNLSSRVVIIIALLIILFLIWAELAVGIFGTPFAGN